MKSKFKLLLVTTLAILILNILTPVAAFAATWNGVSGVSDAVVNSITQYENEAASYNSQISTLTTSINQNQATIDLWTSHLAAAQDPNNPNHVFWKGREAECQATIDNNRGPMN